MRAPEQGGEVAVKELGAGRGPRRRQGRQAWGPPGPSYAHPSHVHSSGTCTCRGGPVPSLTPARGEAGSH